MVCSKMYTNTFIQFELWLTLVELTNAIINQTKILTCWNIWEKINLKTMSSLFFFLVKIYNLNRYSVCTMEASENVLSILVDPEMKVVQLCLILRYPMDGNLPGISVHGILQARILAWVAIPLSKGPPQPRVQTHSSRTAGRFFNI